MKVLTVKTLEVIEPDVQRDIHYILRMEHHTDYVFIEKNAKQYASTISMENTSEVIDKIVSNTSKIPEYTIIIDDLDTESRRITRCTVKNGEIIKKQEGEWEWDA